MARKHIGKTLFKIVKSTKDEVVIREDYSREFTIIKGEHTGLWYAYDEKGESLNAEKGFKSKSEAILFTKQYIEDKR